MPDPVSKAQLVDAALDATTFAGVVTGAADIANPGHEDGTVNDRNGGVHKTLARMQADADAIMQSYIPSDIRTVLLNTSGTGAATANDALIRAALSLGGKIVLLGDGIAYVPGTSAFILNSNTEVEIAAGLTICYTAGSGKDGIFRSAAYARGWSTVTLSWSSGLECSVAWTAHGLTTNDFAYLDGAVDGSSNVLPQFYGVFRVVSVTDANNFVVRLVRCPTTTPSGTSHAKLADQNIRVHGKGLLNYNYPNATPASTGTHEMGILMFGCASCSVDVRVAGTPKFRVCFAAVQDFSIKAEAVGAGTSDVAKVYGPAFFGEIVELSGQANDDSLSFQCKENAAFPSFVISAGDILGISGGNIYTDIVSASAPALSVYCHPIFFTDNVHLSGFSFTGTVGPTVNVRTAETGTSTFGRLSFSNFRSHGRAGTMVQCVATSGAGITGASLRVGELSLPPSQVLGPISLLTINGVSSNLVIDNVVLDGASGAMAANVSALYVSGAQVKELTIRNIRAQSAGTSNYAIAANGGVINRLIMENSDFTGFKGLLLQDSGNAGLIWSMSNITSDCNFGALVNADITLSFQNCGFTGATGGLLRYLGAGSPNITVYERGGNSFSGGSVLFVNTGTPTKAFYGWDLPVDVTTLSRVSGSHCFNSNATAGGGTALAGPMVCDATGTTGSWHSLYNPSSKTY